MREAKPMLGLECRRKIAMWLRNCMSTLRKSCRSADTGPSLGKPALSESMAGILSAITAEWQFNPP